MDRDEIVELTRAASRDDLVRSRVPHSLEIFVGDSRVTLFFLFSKSNRSVLESAITLEVSELKALIESHMVSMLSVKTCCSLWILASEVNATSLASSAAAFFAANIEKILASPHFDSNVLSLVPTNQLSRVSSLSVVVSTFPVA